MRPPSRAWGDSAVDGAQPGTPLEGSTGVIHIPQPRSLGEAQVATGFPKSTEGALAQLIAIDRRAIESGSVVTAQDVIAAWAAPGGPTPDSWSGVAAVQSLLESAGLPANGSTELAIQLEPAMGLVAGRDADRLRRLHPQRHRSRRRARPDRGGRLPAHDLDRRPLGHRGGRRGRRRRRRCGREAKRRTTPGISGWRSSRDREPGPDDRPQPVPLARRPGQGEAWRTRSPR